MTIKGIEISEPIDSVKFYKVNNDSQISLLESKYKLQVCLFDVLTQDTDCYDVNYQNDILIENIIRGFNGVRFKLVVADDVGNETSTDYYEVIANPNRTLLVTKDIIDKKTKLIFYFNRPTVLVDSFVTVTIAILNKDYTVENDDDFTDLVPQCIVGNPNSNCYFVAEKISKRH